MCVERGGTGGRFDATLIKKQIEGGKRTQDGETRCEKENN